MRVVNLLSYHHMNVVYATMSCHVQYYNSWSVRCSCEKRDRWNCTVLYCTVA